MWGRQLDAQRYRCSSGQVHLKDLGSESGDALHDACLPTDSIISLRHELRDGASAKLTLVGKERPVGVTLFLAGETTLSRTFCCEDRMRS